MKDVHEVVWGDAGFLTFWLEQDYTLDGTRHHISAPTSVALRREGGHWKVVLFHSVPLPE
jgi:ketosteroid isomerase-like protein